VGCYPVANLRNCNFSNMTLDNVCKSANVQVWTK